MNVCDIETQFVYSTTMISCQTFWNKFSRPLLFAFAQLAHDFEELKRARIFTDVTGYLRITMLNKLELNKNIKNDFDPTRVECYSSVSYQLITSCAMTLRRTVLSKHSNYLHSLNKYVWPLTLKNIKFDIVGILIKDLRKIWRCQVISYKGDHFVQ